MIELVPVMLFILGWHPDHPGEIDLQRPEIVFLSMEECEATGARMAERMTAAAKNKSGAVYEHRCMNLPAQDEFKQALGELDKEPQ